MINVLHTPKKIHNGEIICRKGQNLGLKGTRDDRQREGEALERL